MDRRFTFGDQLELLAITYPVSETGRMRSLSRAAIRGVYAELTLKWDWSHLARGQMILTESAYSTGTVATSGTTVTLTGGTWPDWAGNGQLALGNDRFEVEERVSDTVLRLKATHPVETASGQAFTLALASYALADDFGQMVAVYGADGNCPITVLTDRQFADWSRDLQAPSTPLYCKVGAGRAGALRLYLSPAPGSAGYVKVEYRAQPRMFGTTVPYSEGAITIVGNEVTGAGTVFPLGAEGMIFRVGSAAQAPTSLIGSYPYTQAYAVLRRVSATELVLAETAALDVATFKYTLDDPLDIDPYSMKDYFDRAVEYRFETLAKISDGKKLQLCRDQMMEAFSRARAMDHRDPKPTPQAGSGSFDGFYPL